jgi:hypothetical protein
MRKNTNKTSNLIKQAYLASGNVQVRLGMHIVKRNMQVRLGMHMVNGNVRVRLGMHPVIITFLNQQNNKLLNTTFLLR